MLVKLAKRGVLGAGQVKQKGGGVFAATYTYRHPVARLMMNIEFSSYNLKFKWRDI